MTLKVFTEVGKRHIVNEADTLSELTTMSHHKAALLPFRQRNDTSQGDLGARETQLISQIPKELWKVV